MKDLYAHFKNQAVNEVSSAHSCAKQRWSTLRLPAFRLAALAATETPLSPAAKAQAALAHWAFKSPVKTTPPPVKNKSWIRNPIDNFVLARLEKEKLKPSPEADKATLLRRLSLDLIGLPPTIAELDAFLADKSNDAYEKQVERLLASPHYGERWGRIWLDAARYADSDGFEKDKPRFIWNYRDWVINAFNQNLPYDQFVIQQIAGDQLPHPTQDQLIATGFLRNSMLNEEGGVDPEQFRMDTMFDRMDAVGKSVLGLTIQCAQCHNHKFDPLTQEEYYKMFAFLNNDHEASMVAYTAPEQEQRSNLLRQMRDLESGLRHTTPRLGTTHGRMGGLGRGAINQNGWNSNVATLPVTTASVFIILQTTPSARQVTRPPNGPPFSKPPTAFRSSAGSGWNNSPTTTCPATAQAAQSKACLH